MDRNSQTLQELKDIVITTIDLINKEFAAFQHHRLKETDKAEEIRRILSEKIKEQNVNLFQVDLSDWKSVNSQSDALAIFNYMAKIVYNLGKINENVKNKVKDGILFTDKAAAELKEIFTGAGTLLQHIHDILVTDNPVLIKFVTERSMELWNKADDFATEHEERLIKGICMPKASVIYLLILDSLKDILWFEREIIKCIRYEEPEGMN